jgi:hypothetical protein
MVGWYEKVMSWLESKERGFTRSRYTCRVGIEEEGVCGETSESI